MVTNLESLTKTIWRSGVALTMADAEKIALAIMRKNETREQKQTRVLRAEEIR